MTAVWMVFRAGLRRRWPAWLALAVVVGLFGGTVTAVAAGARRTDAAYPGLVRWSRSPDDLVNLGTGQGATFASLPAVTTARLPQVTGAARVTTFTALDPAAITVMAPATGDIPGRLWRRKLLAGRLPDPAQQDQADISFTVAQAQHLTVGGTLRVVLLGVTGKPVPFLFHVAGIDAAPGEFPPQYGFGIDAVWATPAFSRQHGGELLSSPAVALRLRHGGAEVPVVEREISRMAGGKAVSDYPLGPQAANTGHSIHLQAVTLWLLAGLLAVIGLLVVGQLLARQSFLESVSHGGLRAVGMSRAQLAVAGLIRAAMIGAAGAVLAVIFAVAASPLFPAGLAGVAEPRPGLDADWLVLGFGMAGVVIATVACAAWPAWRAAVVSRRPASVPRKGRPVTAVIAVAVQPVSAAMGIRLALRRGAGQTALPVLSTIAAAAVGVTALSAALVFASSLGNLLASPWLYGVTWDAVVGSVQFSGLGPAAHSIAHDPQVSAWSGTYLSIPIEIRGVQVGAITASQHPHGLLAAVPVQGRPPGQTGDIVLGEQTLAALHAHLGETVTVSIAGSRRQIRRKIVGTAVFPAVSDTTELGTGAELTASGLRGLAPPHLPLPPFTALLIRFRPGVSTQKAISALASRVDRLGPFGVLGPPNPANLVNFGQVQALPQLAGLSCGLLALLTIVHLLLTSARRRRRDLAILRTLGFTPRQVRATVAWQAITLTAVALIIGIPAGLMCGRLAWRTFTGQLGTPPVLHVPALSFAALTALALVLAVALAAGPAESAIRDCPADVLKAE